MNKGTTSSSRLICATTPRRGHGAGRAAPASCAPRPGGAARWPENWCCHNVRLK
ncbi:MAG: hypothetical protein VB143_06555 [Burkholderia sp.]